MSKYLTKLGDNAKKAFKNIDAKTKYPVATKVMMDTFFLGTSPVICQRQADYVCGIVDKFFSEKLS